MNKVRWMLLSVAILTLTVLAGCTDEKPKEEQLEIQNVEEILSIGAGYESGFFGKGAYYIVETDIQTHSLKTYSEGSLTSFTLTILNNKAEADKLYLVGKGDAVYDQVIELTPNTYKKLSKEFTEKTGMTLKYEGQTIDEYIEENKYK